MRRPITVMVAMAAIMFAATMALSRMSIDIFPELETPLIYVVQPYGGMDPAQMEGYITNYTEFYFLLITGIHHVESMNIQSIAMTKLAFHPGTNMAAAMAETVNYVNRSKAFMPPGTLPPIIMRYDASSVPVGFLVFDSKTKNVGQVQDEATFKVRPYLASLRGVSAPPSFGGDARTIVTRLDPERLRAYRLSPDDVVAALISGNQVYPSGNVVMGDKFPIVPVNSVVTNIKDLEKIPINLGPTPVVYLGDIGKVADETDVPVGYTLVNGHRSVILPITKRPDASTLSVVNLVKENLPQMRKALSQDIELNFEFDQSPYVAHAVSDVVREGILGAVLTGLMILLFLGDWRSVVVVVLTIPLALLFAIVVMWLIGQSINIMTLGGLALAIGILVDEATVAIENIHVWMARPGTSIARAVWEGTTETVVPRLLAMLCILAVFIPALFMEGVVRDLFIPLSLAVGFSMVASFLLSSTFVPVLAAWILKPHKHAHDDAHKDGHAPAATPAYSILAETDHGNSLFGKFSWLYSRLLNKFVPHGSRRWLVIGAYCGVCTLIIVLLGMQLGREIFPKVDAGQFRLRLRAPDGTTLETMEELTKDVVHVIEEESEDKVEISIALVGTASNNFPINFIYIWTAGPHEALIRVAFKENSGLRVEKFKEQIRDKLASIERKKAPAFKDVRIAFEAGDIVSEIMSFGSPTPIEIAVVGPNLEEDRTYAEKIRVEMSRIKSLRDLQYVESLDYPTLPVEVDREKAGFSGLTIQGAARSLVAATSSSRYVVPNFWRDPNSGIGYQVQVEIPLSQMGSVDSIGNVPVKRTAKSDVLLRDVSRIRQGTMPGQYHRYNMRRLVSLTADIEGEDLGRVAAHLKKALYDAGDPPRGITVDVRGQVGPLGEMFTRLFLGLAVTVVAVFLLLTAYFQSPALAFIAVTTVPAAVSGVVLSLFITGTTLNLQSFMGTIMAVGVAMANAILLVTFAERRRLEGDPAVRAAVEGAASRLRPILMTSCAMVSGMIPMALALGEGGEQTAPLGRAVVGGLLAATVATLLILPAIFAMVRGSSGRLSPSLSPNDPDSTRFDGAAGEHSV
jgi:multidrug efflux pump subunit AcrB